jgi:hypothetical protein
VAVSPTLDRARTLACKRLPRLLEQLGFEVGELPKVEQDAASLAKTLTNCQRALSHLTTDCNEDGDWTRSEQASLLAAACNALNLHAHLSSIGSPIAEKVLDGVERSLEKAARLELMPPRWGPRAVVGLEL